MLSMGTLLLALLSVVATTGCNQCESIENVEIVEAQVLCVYWAENSTKEQGVLPAIVYKITPISTIPADADFFLNFPVEGGAFNRLPLKKNFSKASKSLIGFTLESRYLHDFFVNDEFIEGGPCYEKSLKEISELATVHFELNSCTKSVSKSNNYNIIVGVK